MSNSMVVLEANHQVVLKVNPNGRSQSEPQKLFAEPHVSLMPASMSFMYELKLASLLP